MLVTLQCPLWLIQTLLVEKECNVFFTNKKVITKVEPGQLPPLSMFHLLVLNSDLLRILTVLSHQHLVIEVTFLRVYFA